MWWPGSGNSGGSWLPEEKKANMWHRRGNSGGSWPPAFPRSLGSGKNFPLFYGSPFRRKHMILPRGGGGGKMFALRIFFCLLFKGLPQC